MMFSCKRATELMSESLDSKLSLYKRFALRMHLFMCKFCTRCWKQLLFLKDTMQICSERAEEIDFMPDYSLSSDACDRIKSSFKEQSHQ
jgi:hypothetical protein